MERPLNRFREEVRTTADHPKILDRENRPAGSTKRTGNFIGMAPPMPKLDRYLLRDFVQSFLATLIVLLTVSLGGVLVDVLGEIADGGLPARLLLSQLGLQLLVYL